MRNWRIVDIFHVKCSVTTILLDLGSIHLQYIPKPILQFVQVKIFIILPSRVFKCPNGMETTSRPQSDDVTFLLSILLPTLALLSEHRAKEICIPVFHKIFDYSRRWRHRLDSLKLRLLDCLDYLYTRIPFRNNRQRAWADAGNWPNWVRRRRSI